MRFGFQKLASVAVILLVLSGCATYHHQKVEPTTIVHARQEIPEDLLLDVGILVFDSETISEDNAVHVAGCGWNAI